MDHSAAIAGLAAQPYFKMLDEGELDRLARLLITRTYNKDESVFLEGEPNQGLYIVGAGSVKISKLSAEGREQILRYMVELESFNEVAVFDGGPNPAHAAAAQANTSVWILPRAAIVELIQQRPDVAWAIIQNLGARLRHLVGLVEDLSLRQVSARLAKLLLEIATGQGPALTQHEMAARLGTVREMISRSLKQLEARGLIQVEHGKIVILDQAGLEKLV